jgi:hypothetical protein
VGKNGGKRGTGEQFKNHLKINKDHLKINKDHLKINKDTQRPVPIFMFMATI